MVHVKVSAALKRIFVLCAFVAAFNGFYVQAFAQNLDSGANQVLNEVLNSSAVSVPGQTSVVTAAAVPTPSTITCPNLTNTLSIGLSGPQVTALQTYLALDPLVFPEGKISGYFGPLTQQAVERFQVKYGIATHGPSWSTGYGIVGPKTRAAIAADCAAKQAAQVAQSGVQAASTSSRVEIPITQTVLTDGTIRYSIPITIGNTTIQAQFDTGETGIRVVPSAGLAATDYATTPYRNSVGYNGGAQFAGAIVEATIGIGGLHTSVPINVQYIDDISCIAAIPNCPAIRVSKDQYLVAGDGLAGQGFKATLGIGMLPSPVQNPLTFMGGSALIELPLPGSSVPGKLIINPTAAETTGFVTTQAQSKSITATQVDNQTFTGWDDRSLPGCIHNLTTGRDFCYPTLYDVGAGSLQIYSDEFSKNDTMTPGDSIRFTAWGGKGYGTTVGSSNPHKVVVGPTLKGISTSINAGITPFFHFDFLYNYNNGTVGIRAR